MHKSLSVCSLLNEWWVIMLHVAWLESKLGAALTPPATLPTSNLETTCTMSDSGLHTLFTELVDSTFPKLHKLMVENEWAVFKIGLGSLIRKEKWTNCSYTLEIFIYTYIKHLHFFNLVFKLLATSAITNFITFKYSINLVCQDT